MPCGLGLFELVEGGIQIYTTLSAYWQAPLRELAHMPARSQPTNNRTEFPLALRRGSACRHDDITIRSRPKKKDYEVASGDASGASSYIMRHISIGIRVEHIQCKDRKQ